MKLFTRPIVLKSMETEWGWSIKSISDLVLALEGYKGFATVAEGYILDALKEVAAEDKVWTDVKELGNYILANYI